MRSLFGDAPLASQRSTSNDADLEAARFPNDRPAADLDFAASRRADDLETRRSPSGVSPNPAKTSNASEPLLVSSKPSGPANKRLSSPSPQLLFEAQKLIAQIISRSEGQTSGLDDLCRLIEAQLPAAACAILLYQPRNHSLRLTAAPSLPANAEHLVGDVPVDPSGASCSASFFHSRVVLAEDASNQSLLAHFPQLDVTFGSCLSLPVREPGSSSERGRILGILDCYFSSELEAVDELVAAAKSAAALAGVVLSLSLQQKSLHQKRQHDPITDLPSRRLFSDRLRGIIEAEEARPAEEKARLVVAALDIDGFRDVNDTLGFQVGDLLLRAVADRLQAHVRDDSIVARSGGDEFLLLQRGQRTEEEVLEGAERLVQRLNQPYDFGGHGLYVPISVGISVYPWDGQDSQTLLRHAESALQSCKEQGGGSFSLYRPSVTRARPTVERWFQETRLTSQLRDALGRNEFELHYQLKFTTDDQKPCGAEALLRWHHPELGLLRPEAFIQAAEQHGYMHQIGEWSIQQTCLQAKKWADLGFDDLVISVNVSPSQFRHGNFLRIVESALDESGMNPHNLEIEIIERLAMEDTRLNQGRLQALHKLGVGIAIDDFGTGFSSLSYLNSFKFDALKIDRSFISEIGGGGDKDRDNRNIVLAILSIAHNLSLKVVAEGVETPTQLEFLRENGCEFVQGFLLAMPKPAGEITQVLYLHRPAGVSPRV